MKGGLETIRKRGELVIQSKKFCLKPSFFLRIIGSVHETFVLPIKTFGITCFAFLINLRKWEVAPSLVVSEAEEELVSSPGAKRPKVCSSKPSSSTSYTSITNVQTGIINLVYRLACVWPSTMSPSCLMGRGRRRRW